MLCYCACMYLGTRVSILWGIKAALEESVLGIFLMDCILKDWGRLRRL